ncbi:hypothetical protein XENOCAPTIV_010089, partial [Xenoophorus captivus]
VTQASFQIKRPQENRLTVRGLWISCFPAGCRIGRFLTASGEPCPPSSIPPKTAQLWRLSVARCLLQDCNLSPWRTNPNLTVSSLAEYSLRVSVVVSYLRPFPCSRSADSVSSTWS